MATGTTEKPYVVNVSRMSFQTVRGILIENGIKDVPASVIREIVKAVSEPSAHYARWASAINALNPEAVQIL